MSASFALSALVAGLATGDCALPGTDCDGNGLQDSCEMANNPLLDCDANLVLDVCDLQGAGLDLDGNGILDVCDCGTVGKPLPHPGPIPNENFGRSVDIEGPRVVVSARDSDAVYVFRQEGDQWVFEAELVSEDQNGDGQPDIQGFFLGWGLRYFFGPPIKSFIERYLGLVFAAGLAVLFLGFWGVQYL